MWEQLGMEEQVTTLKWIIIKKKKRKWWGGYIQYPSLTTWQKGTLRMITLICWIAHVNYYCRQILYSNFILTFFEWWCLEKYIFFVREKDFLGVVNVARWIYDIFIDEYRIDSIEFVELIDSIYSRWYISRPLTYIFYCVIFPSPCFDTWENTASQEF